jgi:hypothetical protein
MSKEIGSDLSEVTEGVKYVLRPDVMYGPVGQFAG